MRTMALVSSVILILFIAFAGNVEAQIPKEGPTSYTGIYSGTYKALGTGPDLFLNTYEHMGAMLSDTGEGIFHNATFHCIGSQYVVKGDFEYNSGFCILTRPDGDKAFFTFKGTGNIRTGGKQTNTFVGGTGKLAGLQGSAEVTTTPLRASGPPSTPYQGSYQGLSKSKGQYKLP